MYLSLFLFWFLFLMIQMSYAKHISESLGAQINPDISWTSSLNTPPPVPSTLILCKPIADSLILNNWKGYMFINFLSPFNLAAKVDESPCPVSVSADKSVVVSTQSSTNIQQTYLYLLFWWISLNVEFLVLLYSHSLNGYSEIVTC